MVRNGCLWPIASEYLKPVNDHVSELEGLLLSLERTAALTDS